MPRLAEAIARNPNLYIQVAVWLSLLTGVRQEELLWAQWDDVDFAGCKVPLGETEAGRTHYIPLSAPTMALLRQLPRHEGNPYLASSLEFDVTIGLRKGKDSLCSVRRGTRVFILVRVGDQACDEIDHTAVAGMLDLTDVLELVVRIEPCSKEF